MTAAKKAAPKKAVATVAKELPVPAQANPGTLVQMAVEQGADIEKLSRLMDLQERWEAKEAIKLFFRALSDFQSILPAITKKKQVKFNTTDYMYAPLGDIVEQIREPMHLSGLSYRFRQTHGDQISITCIVSHIGGHSEEVSMDANADTTGNKNSIQGLGSTVTYLQRYTLCSALGIATADQDMDGRMPKEFITPGQAESLKARLETVNGDEVKFCKAMRVSAVAEIHAKHYSQADKILTQKEVKTEVPHENN